MRRFGLSALGRGMASAGLISAPPVETLYPYYDGLDLADVPFHNGSGGWGGQVPLQSPAAPSVSGGSVGVSTLSGMQTAFALGARSVTVNNGSVFAGGTISTSVTDCELILGTGVSITGDLLFAVASSRFRIRGPSMTAYSGGRVHSLRFGGGVWFDLAILCIGITGDTDHAVQIHNGCNRFVMARCRVLSDRCGFLAQAPFTHAAFLGNTVITGLAAGSDAAWGIRCGGVGPFVLKDNHIEGNRFHRVRFAPPANDHLAWIVENVFVDLVESRILWVNSGSGSQEGLSAGVWFLLNYLYTNGGGLSVDTAHGGPGSGTQFSDGNFSSAAYVRANDNTVFGPFTNANIQIDNPNLVDGQKTGNQFFAATTPPTAPLTAWN